MIHTFHPQDEEHLQEAIAMIEQYQEQHQQVMARLASRIDASAKEFSAIEGSRMPPPSPLPGGANEVRASQRLRACGMP